MSENEILVDKESVSPWAQHRFMLLVTGAILVSLFLVGVALALYASSGAAQLDLSRPGYVSVREQADQPNQFDGFSASGDINKNALDQFRGLYNEQAKKATSVDSFGGTVLSDQTLSIDSPPGDGAN
jgi:hypothetical protein